MKLSDFIAARDWHLLVVLVGVIAVLLFSTLRPGEEWDGDDAIYIMNSRNIVLGLPYSRTPYIFNPDNAINPSAYPPGLPLLIAPVYRAFGVDLAKMKLVCLSTFVIFLFVYFRVASRFLSTGLALAATAAVGLHPFIWDRTNTLSSELPFMLFCYTALLLLNRIQAYSVAEKWSAGRYGVVAVAASMVAFAYLTRSIGVFLFPAAYFVAVLRTRRLANTTALVLAAAAVLAIGVQLHFPADNATYLGYFKDFSLASPIHAAGRYRSALANFFIGVPAYTVFTMGTLLLVLVVGLAAFGFALQSRSRFSVYEAFFAAYVGFLLIYPSTLEPARYLMPVWPLLVLYVCIGLQAVMRRLPSARSALGVLSSCAVVILYAAGYLRMERGPVPYSMDARPSIELFSSIISEVPEHAGVLARKPTIIALYTDRPSTIWPEHFTDQQLWSYLARLGIRYVVQDYAHLGVIPVTPDPLDSFVQRNASLLRPVFKNEWFAFYRIDTYPHGSSAASSDLGGGNK
jgi:4-amino-4-deoxy-L-arabinose transferase-like glycosyltransferase